MKESEAQRDVRITRAGYPHITDPIQLAVEAIERDICDRRGLKSDWASIDEGIREDDIKPKWVEIIKEAIKGSPDILLTVKIISYRDLEDAVFTLGMALSRFGKGTDYTVYQKGGPGGQDSYAGLPHGCRFADSILEPHLELIMKIKSMREKEKPQ